MNLNRIKIILPHPLKAFKVSEEGLKKLAHLAGFDNPETADKDVILTKKK